MELIQLPDTLDQLVFEASPPRTPGLHLSQIIRSICQSLEPGKYQDGPINPLYTELGFTFERVLEMAFQARRADIFRPGEFDRDGIICSPDGISLEDLEWLEEFKCTEMGMPADASGLLDPKFRKWLWQIGAYCHVLDLTRARLRVLWLRGDYKKIRRAYCVYEIIWTQDELAHTWNLLVSHAKEKGWLS